MDDTIIEEQICRLFNEKHPVGSAVTVIKDDGSCIQTQIRFGAEVSSSGTPVIFLIGIRGYFLLSRVIG